MKTIRPLQDKVLLKLIETDSVSKGGIFIPPTAKDKPMEGRIVAVGNGKILENGTVVAMSVKVGDRVLFAKYTGTEVRVDEEGHLVVREDDILAVVEE
jgi:chaperonin GroES